VPRYFFHFSDGKRQLVDTTGIELSGLAAARRHAIAQVRDRRGALSEPHIRDLTGWKLVVADTNARIVYEVGFDLKRIPA
jgi:hypothetical protein